MKLAHFTKGREYWAWFFTGTQIVNDGPCFSPPYVSLRDPKRFINENTRKGTLQDVLLPYYKLMKCCSEIYMEEQKNPRMLTKIYVLIFLTKSFERQVIIT